MKCFAIIILIIKSKRSIIIFNLSILLSILTMAISTIVPNKIVLIAVQIVLMFSIIAGGTNVLVNELMKMIHAQSFEVCLEERNAEGYCIGLAVNH